MIFVACANVAFNGLSHAAAPVFCFQPSFAVTVGAGTVTSFVGFTQYIVVWSFPSTFSNVPCSPAEKSTFTKFDGTLGLSSPGFCGTTSSEYLAVNVVSATVPVLSANLAFPSNQATKFFVASFGIGSDGSATCGLIVFAVACAHVKVFFTS